MNATTSDWTGQTLTQTVGTFSELSQRMDGMSQQINGQTQRNDGMTQQFAGLSDQVTGQIEGMNEDWQTYQNTMSQ